MAEPADPDMAIEAGGGDAGEGGESGAERWPGARRWTVPAALDGERVDRSVALLAGLTRHEVAALIDAGGVVLSDRLVDRPGRRVKPGDVLEADVGSVATRIQVSTEPDPSVPVAVVWEDSHVLVVDKAAGVVVHPGNGNRTGTLVAGLLARYPDLAAAGPDEARPGIVHRLDKGTSGLLVVARTVAAREALVAQMAARRVQRHYAVLVAGRLDADEGLVDAPLGRSAHDPTAMAVRIGGRVARTRYTVVERFDTPMPATRLECRLETGRTHQIRVHLSAIGHPVVGDERYDKVPPGGDRPPRLLPPGRPWLHAQTLAFEHPATGETVRFTSELPADLADALRRFA